MTNFQRRRLAAMLGAIVISMYAISIGAFSQPPTCVVTTDEQDPTYEMPCYKNADVSACHSCDCNPPGVGITCPSGRCSCPHAILINQLHFYCKDAGAEGGGKPACLPLDIAPSRCQVRLATCVWDPFRPCGYRCEDTGINSPICELENRGAFGYPLCS
jgi:hypothetical protein